MRKTIQYQIIQDTIQKMHGHPTAEDVYQEIHKEFPTISKATVYRNLHQLADNKIINQLLIPDSPERFDIILPKHYHFRCKKCSEIFDVNIDYLSEINDTVQNTYGFQIDDHEIIFKGVCPKCQDDEKL